MKLVPKDSEMDRVLIAAREQCKMRLRLSGIDPDNDSIPDNVLNACIKNVFSSLDFEALMPEHFAELKRVKAEVDARWAVSSDESLSLSERMHARSEVETRIKEDKWIKNLMIDYPSAVRAEMEDVKVQFLARVKLGKGK